MNDHDRGPPFPSPLDVGVERKLRAINPPIDDISPDARHDVVSLGIPNLNGRATSGPSTSRKR
jgi:hypothetical protein